MHLKALAGYLGGPAGDKMGLLGKKFEWKKVFHTSENISMYVTLAATKVPSNLALQLG
jgi:hypothetical protein